MCSSGPVTMSVKTDRRGYCPGESILLSALFENYSNRTIIPYASLFQTQTFNANGKQFVCTNKLKTISGLIYYLKKKTYLNCSLLNIPKVLQFHLKNLTSG